MNALCLVAHPDDEALFAGSLIASRPHWEWTLIALTGGERERQFPGLSLGLPDHWRILTVPEYREWKSNVRDLALQPDLVFTHNLLGEYGHPHHMAVHRIAHELFPRVFDFHSHAETSVGPQFQRIACTEVAVDDAKRRRFLATYGEPVFADLSRHQPEMMRAAFAGPECFTGNGLVPG